MNLFVNITGAAENQSPQKHAIRNSYQSYPTGITWTVNVGHLNTSTEEFFENLFLLAEKNGGNSYFYPDQNANQTLCRFEWHLPWRNRAATVRVGIVFHHHKGSVPTTGTGYFATEESYAKDGKEPRIKKISEKKLFQFKDFLADEIKSASRRSIDFKPMQYLFIHYVEMPHVFKVSNGFSLLGGTIRILPSRMHEEKHVAAVLVRCSGKTKGDARRASREKFSLLLALGSLAIGSTLKEVMLDKAPLEVIGKILRFKISVAEKIYGDAFTDVKFETKSLTAPSKTFWRSLVAHFDGLPESAQEDLKQAIFAHYGALRILHENQALAIVGFLAGMGALSNSYQRTCPGEVSCSECGKVHSHNLVGDRKAISEKVIDVMSKSFSVESDVSKAIDSWIKRLYNDHRSSFVHSANHRFDQFNQSNQKSPTSGSPTALPSEHRIVRKLNEFSTDFGMLPSTSRILLLHEFGDDVLKLAQKSQFKYEVPSYCDRYTNEAFVGFPTSGWVMAAGQ